MKRFDKRLVAVLSASLLVLGLGIVGRGNASEIHTDNIDIQSNEAADISITQNGEEFSRSASGNAQSSSGPGEASAQAPESMDSTQAAAPQDTGQSSVDSAIPDTVDGEQAADSTDQTVVDDSTAQQEDSTPVEDTDTDTDSADSSGNSYSSYTENNVNTYNYDNGVVSGSSSSTKTTSDGTNTTTDSSTTVYNNNSSQTTTQNTTTGSDGKTTTSTNTTGALSASLVVSGFSIPDSLTMTGAGDFDSVDYDNVKKTNLGKDSSQENAIVRNNDTVTYSVVYELDVLGSHTAVEKEAFYGQQTDLFMKVTLPFASSQAEFDLDQIKNAGCTVISHNKTATEQVLVVKRTDSYAGSARSTILVPVKIRDMVNDSQVYIRVQMSTNQGSLDAVTSAESMRVTVTSTNQANQVSQPTTGESINNNGTVAAQNNVTAGSSDTNSSVEKAMEAASNLPKKSEVASTPLTGIKATYGPGGIQP